jgi:hypothetical protein
MPGSLKRPNWDPCKSTVSPPKIRSTNWHTDSSWYFPLKCSETSSPVRYNVQPGWSTLDGFRNRHFDYHRNPHCQCGSADRPADIWLLQRHLQVVVNVCRPLLTPDDHLGACLCRGLPATFWARESEVTIPLKLLYFFLILFNSMINYVDWIIGLIFFL